MFTYKMTFRGQILRRMDLLTGEITERESLYTKPEFSIYLAQSRSISRKFGFAPVRVTNLSHTYYLHTDDGEWY